MDAETEKELAALKDALHEAQHDEVVAFKEMMGEAVVPREKWDKARLREHDARVAVSKFLNENPEAR